MWQWLCEHVRDFAPASICELLCASSAHDVEEWNGQSLHRPLATAKHSFLTVDKQQSQDKLQMLLGLVQSTPPASRRLICASARNPPRSVRFAADLEKRRRVIVFCNTVASAQAVDYFLNEQVAPACSAHLPTACSPPPLPAIYPLTFEHQTRRFPRYSRPPAPPAVLVHTHPCAVMRRSSIKA